jgi:UDP-N-acetyl-D-glucosamine dehydrogenase
MKELLREAQNSDLAKAGATSVEEILFANLLDRVRGRTARVMVIGLGYVGLPLALRAAESGFSVTGFDVDSERVRALAEGRSYLVDVPSVEVAAQLTTGNFRPAATADSLAQAHVIVICVPTPLNNGLPDMSHIEGAARVVASHSTRGQLVILESTTYPGTTEELLQTALSESGLEAGSDFFLGFSPERIDPGNESFGISNVPKIVGGIDERSTDLMQAFYETFVQKVVRVSSPKVAEMAKLLENTYRHVNIALINEIAILCHDLRIDVWEVIDAAATKPFGFEAFYPGPGWGGHCIPVDPAYLSWRLRQMGETARFVELAREINSHMPRYVVQRITECLNDVGKALRGSSILVLGVTYKADIEDTRESPALEIIGRLVQTGTNIAFHDPYVESIPIPEGSLSRAELRDDVIGSVDLVLILTDHSSYDWQEVGRAARLILDTRNAMKHCEGPIVRI